MILKTKFIHPVRENDVRKANILSTCSNTYILMVHEKATKVSQALWFKLPHHSHADGTQRGQNGKPGLVVEITTPLTT